MYFIEYLIGGQIVIGEYDIVFQVLFYDDVVIVGGGVVIE